MAAISLIVKYLNGDSSPEEALRIEQWAASSPENQVLLEDTWRAWMATSGEPVHDVPDPSAEWKRWQQQLSRPSPGKPSGGRWLKGHLFQVAGAVLVAGLTLWFFSLRHPRQEQKIPVALHQTKGQKFNAPDSARESSRTSEDSVRIFDFRNTTLEEASRQLSKAYSVQIIPRNPRIFNCRFTTRFDHESLTYMLDVITETLNIHYAYSPDRKTVYLSGKGCD